MTTKRDGCGLSPLHVAVAMNDALAAMEHLHLGVPTQTRDIRWLTPDVSARTPRFCADLIDRTPLDQWVVLKRVRALVPCDTADTSPPSTRPTQSPSSGRTRAAGPSGSTPAGAAASSPLTSAA